MPMFEDSRAEASWSTCEGEGLRNLAWDSAKEPWGGGEVGVGGRRAGG